MRCVALLCAVLLGCDPADDIEGSVGGAEPFAAGGSFYLGNPPASVVIASATVSEGCVQQQNNFQQVGRLTFFAAGGPITRAEDTVVPNSQFFNRMNGSTDVTATYATDGVAQAEWSGSATFVFDSARELVGSFHLSAGDDHLSGHFRAVPCQVQSPR